MQSAMVATDDTESIDYDVHYDTAFVCTRKTKEVVLFTKSDITIDNGASRSVFCNEVEQETLHRWYRLIVQRTSGNQTR
jgi:hypothetical protein